MEKAGNLGMWRKKGENYTQNKIIKPLTHVSEVRKGTSLGFRNVAYNKATRFEMAQERKWEGRKMAFSIVCKAIGNG